MRSTEIDQFQWQSEQLTKKLGDHMESIHQAKLNQRNGDDVSSISSDRRAQIKQPITIWEIDDSKPIAAHSTNPFCSSNPPTSWAPCTHVHETSRKRMQDIESKPWRVRRRHRNGQISQNSNQNWLTYDCQITDLNRQYYRTIIFESRKTRAVCCEKVYLRVWTLRPRDYSLADVHTTAYLF